MPTLTALLPALISATLLGMTAANTTVAPTGANFKCEGCMRDVTMKIMYIDWSTAVLNEPARKKAESLGIEYSCDNPAIALPECFVAANWNGGWVGQTFHDVVTKLGVNVVPLTRANFTKEVYNAYTGGSSYTRCVWEVVLGNVDLCVGDFWETAERRRVTAFTSALKQDVFKLTTKKIGNAAFTGLDLLNIFKPFSEGVWAVTAACILIGALCLWVIERSADGDFATNDAGEEMRAPEGMALSLWMALTGYVSGGVSHSVSCWASRFVMFGYALLIYISVSSYTANLANLLVAKSSAVGLIETYEDLTLKGGKLCLLEAIAGLIDTPGVQLQTYDDYFASFEGLYAENCDAAAIGSAEFRIHIAGGQGAGTVCRDENDDNYGQSSCKGDSEPTAVKVGPWMGTPTCECKNKGKSPADCPQDCPDHHKYCEFFEVVGGGSVPFDFQVSFSCPINKIHQDYFSSWIIALSLDGTINGYYSKWVLGMAPGVCDATEAPGDQLDLKSQAGAFFFSGIFMLIGMVIFVVGLFCKSKKPQAPLLEGRKESLEPSRAISNAASEGRLTARSEQGSFKNKEDVYRGGKNTETPKDAPFEYSLQDHLLLLRMQEQLNKQQDLLEKLVARHDKQESPREPQQAGAPSVVSFSPKDTANSNNSVPYSLPTYGSSFLSQQQKHQHQQQQHSVFDTPRSVESAYTSPFAPQGLPQQQQQQQAQRQPYPHLQATSPRAQQSDLVWPRAY